MAYQEPGLYIIPEITLTCSRLSIVDVVSGNLERVEGIIGGELLSGTDVRVTRPFLTITWWQQIGKETNYNLTATTTITELKPIEGRPNVYSFTINLDYARLNVSEGNVLGIGIDTRIFKLYYNASRSGILNHRALPRFEVSDSSPISIIPSTVNVSTDSNAATVIRGVPLLSFGDRGRLYMTIMHECSVLLV